jgi:hypothetical protein
VVDDVEVLLLFEIYHTHLVVAIAGPRVEVVCQTIIGKGSVEVALFSLPELAAISPQVSKVYECEMACRENRLVNAACNGINTVPLLNVHLFYDSSPDQALELGQVRVTSTDPLEIGLVELLGDLKVSLVKLLNSALRDHLL